MNLRNREVQAPEHGGISVFTFVINVLAQKVREESRYLVARPRLLPPATYVYVA
jgi:hypothetical protein